MADFSSEVFQAWENWYLFWSNGNKKFHYLRDFINFEKFIGQELITEPPTPEAAHRVRLLLSPHHYAILKAYKAKHFPQEVS